MEIIFSDQFVQSPWQEVKRGDVTMLCSPAENGMGRIERLISPRPQDYLKAEWQPGALVPLWEE